MSPLYVHALTDRRVKTFHDAKRTVRSVEVGSIFAVCEERTAVPAASEAELRRQHRIVRRIAEAVPAVLPARFGSLVGEAELTAIVRQREDLFRQALETVRDRVQMTIRIADARPPRAPQRVPIEESGREYLERRAAESAAPALPEPLARAAGRVTSLVRLERRASDGSAVYHLIGRADVEGYLAMLPALNGMTVSGPWPPFAFTPELW